MARKQVKRKTRRRSRPKSGRCEWVGGQFTSPFSFEHDEKTFRPELFLWIEQPSGLIVSQEINTLEGAEGFLTETLLDALDRVTEEPIHDGPQRPDAIRVTDAACAAELRTAIGDAIQVNVAPTPELDAALPGLLGMTRDPNEEPSYFEGGRISPDIVAEFFSCAQAFYETAPWTHATEDRVLRMDIPSLEVEGACVSILGSIGAGAGLMIFPSDTCFEIFIDAAMEFARSEGEGPVVLGSDQLSLTFERGADLPKSMRREVASHSWPVADAQAYPIIRSIKPDGTEWRPTEREFEIVSACATVLSAFYERHHKLFELEESEPVSESYHDDYDREVRITLPYEAYALF